MGYCKGARPICDFLILQAHNYPITQLLDYPITELPDLSFTAFVLSLASTAAIHFGDLPDPQSGEQTDPHLEGAAQMIEILALLEQKTRGNLTLEERQVLEQVLYELRLRFVEASGGGKRIIVP